MTKYEKQQAIDHFLQCLAMFIHDYEQDSAKAAKLANSEFPLPKILDKAVSENICRLGHGLTQGQIEISSKQLEIFLRHYEDYSKERLRN